MNDPVSSDITCTSIKILKAILSDSSSFVSTGGNKNVVN